MNNATPHLAELIRRWMNGERLNPAEQALIEGLSEQVAAIQLGRLLLPTLAQQEHRYDDAA